jgi:hypothetical protein
LTAQERVQALVPSPAGWRSYSRALVNLLLFGLVVLLGEWIVHQVEYLIEYGRRFGWIMASTPHRFYMATLGVALGVAAMGLLALAALVLLCARVQRRRLLLRRPPRIARHVSGFALQAPARAMARTALGVAACQMAIYLFQENLESAAVSGSWPGLAVLFAPQHLTVLPLHFLVAACASIVLWALAARIRRSRCDVAIAQTLVAVLLGARSAPPRNTPRRRHLPNLRLIAGSLCLRSPPLAA